MSETHITDTTYPSTSRTEETFSPERPEQQIHNSTVDTMLSVNFDTPLAGEARAERIRQMTSGHPSLAGVQYVHQSVTQLQTTIRRMPGIPSASADNLCEQLQQISQAVGTEFGQLLDAFMNLKLDAEDTGKAIPRMSIETSVASTKLDQVTQELKDACKLLDGEKQKREEAETQVENMMDQLRHIFAGNNNNSGSQNKDVQDLQDRVEHLQDQVNGKRHLWIVHRSHPQEEVTHALSVLVSSVPNKEAVLKTIKEFCNERIAEASGSTLTHVNGGSLASTSSSSVINTPSTPITAAPMTPRGPSNGASIYAPIQAGPPRAPTTIPFERRLQPATNWGNAKNNNNSGMLPPPRTASMSQALIPTSPYNRTPSRRGWQVPRYQGNGRDFNQGFPTYGASSSSTALANRPGTAFNPSARSPWTMAPGPGNSLQTYNQAQAARSPAVYTSTAMPTARNNQLMAPIQLTAAAVQMWRDQLLDFYAQARQFATVFASEAVRPEAFDQLRTSPIWTVLVRTYSPLSERDAIAYLRYHISDNNFKSLLLTRVIIDYMVHVVWKAGVWKGFDQETTQGLQQVEDGLHATADQPAVVRQPLLERQAAIVDSIMSQSDTDSDFHKAKIEYITKLLMGSLESVLSTTADASEAFQRLEDVAHRGFDISAKLLTSRLTFDFRFPEIGSRFSAQSMTALWPTDMAPTDIQARHWRIAMVMTPVVTCRNDTGHNISAHSVTGAEVVCMQ